MKTYNNPDKSLWAGIAKRPSNYNSGLESSVRKIISQVQESGDKALFRLTKELDGVTLDKLYLDTKEIDELCNQVDSSLKEAIEIAISNISRFHSSQKQEPLVTETMPGVKCVLKSLPIEKIGLYIPSGSAPLFSTVLMLGVPAQLAGCKDVVLFTPPSKDGMIAPAIAYCARRLGIEKIVTLGGAQAVAAMAYGTESIVKRDKIFGPGNSYVTKAKELVSQVVAIDMPAGPSELMIIADDCCVPAFVAYDLLSQAEHGPDSQVLLLSDSAVVVENVIREVGMLSANLSRKQQVEGALFNSCAILFDKLENALDFSNFYAPEHLIINTGNSWDMANSVTAAGSVFIGNYSPESAGDYASGTNHTLPTGAWAKSYSGISLDSFMHKITFQELTKDGLLSLSKVISIMANAESLEAHAKAVEVRAEAILQEKNVNKTNQK
ncbi:MAG: histidinol dehydrogenase [Bacteroidales bacterium]|nr:histidinol dehydrogenase [Bacteroidales bacterium]